MRERDRARLVHLVSATHHQLVENKICSQHTYASFTAVICLRALKVATSSCCQILRLNSIEPVAVPARYLYPILKILFSFPVPSDELGFLSCLGFGQEVTVCLSCSRALPGRSLSSVSISLLCSRSPTDISVFCAFTSPVAVTHSVRVSRKLVSSSWYRI